MRQRLLKDRTAKGVFDFKLVRGGMIDIEFLAQTAQLMHPEADWGTRSVEGVIEKSVELNHFTNEEADVLLRAYAQYSGLLALQRVALPGPTAFSDWPAVLKSRAARALKCPDFQSVEQEYLQHTEEVWKIFCRKLQCETTETQSHGV